MHKKWIKSVCTWCVPEHCVPTAFTWAKLHFHSIPRDCCNENYNGCQLYGCKILSSSVINHYVASCCCKSNWTFWIIRHCLTNTLKITLHQHGPAGCLNTGLFLVWMPSKYIIQWILLYYFLQYVMNKSLITWITVLCACKCKHESNQVVLFCKSRKNWIAGFTVTLDKLAFFLGATQAITPLELQCLLPWDPVLVVIVAQ